MKLRRTVPCSPLLCLLLTAVAPAAQNPKTSTVPETAEFFETRVRPVLFTHCTPCHGEKLQMAGLRVDSLAALMKGSMRGAVLAPGYPDQSSLITALRHTGPIKMPPTGKLTDTEIDGLAQWVAMGAPWPQANAGAGKQDPRSFWSLQPIQRTAPPAVRNHAWVQSPIDQFILGALEAKGLSPSAPADRAALIRRAYFDLIGLPPGPAEVEAFLKDRSPGAFARVVDHLLASPRYGERWARHWMDVARYADTKGYVFTSDRNYHNAYTYRDWLIRAFNEDLPYDQFIVQQLAADQLNLGEDRRSLAAMGFLTVGRRFLNNQHDIIDDRIDVIGRGVLGLTISCARCHDHKFDPIKMKDYYALYGVFAASREPEKLPLIGEPDDREAALTFHRDVQEAQATVDRYRNAVREELRSRFRSQVGEYLLAERAATVAKASDDDAFARQKNLNPEVFGRWRSYFQAEARSQDPIFGLWQRFSALPDATFAAEAQALCSTIAEASASPAMNSLVRESLINPPPVSLDEVARRYTALFQQTTQPDASDRNPKLNEDRAALVQFLQAESSPFNLAGDQLDDAFSVEQNAKVRELERKVEQLQVNHPGAPPAAMVLQDVAHPSDARLLLRGNPGNPGEVVPRRFLEVLSAPDARPFNRGSGRIDLAEAIVDRNNPLTARVMVNRVWMHHFGQGLVRTPGNFGMLGERPTHPELLDYLADRFRADGWSLKKLHRTIMLSSAYQQASNHRTDGFKVDPENRLLWRTNRRRLEWEPLRDATLSAAGNLSPSMFGRSVDILKAPFSSRRSVYSFIERQNLPGFFRTFDLASPDTTTPQRHKTTVPQQALFMMNSPFMVEQARHLVTRPEVAGLPPAERIRKMYRLLFCRMPSPDEEVYGLAFVAKAAAGPAQSPAPDPGGRPEQPLSAWEQLAQVLFMTNEFAFID